MLNARLAAAYWSVISDCDETFNYWEPTHRALHGSGMQTWEYSPVYALRSHLYVLSHAVPAKLFSLVFAPPKMWEFYFIRAVLALVCTASEVRGSLENFIGCYYLIRQSQTLT